MTHQNGPSQEHRIMIAGFGGQGVLTLGRVLCLGAMSEGSQLTYLPSYGSEVRGGTAHCHVVISTGPIFTPLVEMADSLIILNELSFERFGDSIRPGGLLVLDSSMVKPGDYTSSHDAAVLPVPATDRATEMGNVLVANMILLGAFVKATGICTEDSIGQGLRQVLTGGKSALLDINLEAFKTGAEFAEKILQTK